MKGPDGFVQAYNVQLAVHELQLIVGQAVTPDTNDKQQLLPMIRTIVSNREPMPTHLLGTQATARTRTWLRSGPCPPGACRSTTDPGAVPCGFFADGSPAMVHSASSIWSVAVPTLPPARVAVKTQAAWIVDGAGMNKKEKGVTSWRRLTFTF